MRLGRPLRLRPGFFQCTAHAMTANCALFGTVHPSSRIPSECETTVREMRKKSCHHDRTPPPPPKTQSPLFLRHYAMRCAHVAILENDGGAVSLHRRSLVGRTVADSSSSSVVQSRRARVVNGDRSTARNAAR